MQCAPRADSDFPEIRHAALGQKKPNALRMQSWPGLDDKRGVRGGFILRLSLVSRVSSAGRPHGNVRAMRASIFKNGTGGRGARRLRAPGESFAGGV